MTKSETALLLAKMASFDQRTTGDADVEAWYEICCDLPFEESMAAVTGWYRNNRERMMPSDLVDAVAPEREIWPT